MTTGIHAHLSDPQMIFLVPDRALNTFALRVLKSWHVRRSKWPLPGIFPISRVAQMLVASSQLTRPTPPRYEIFAELLKLNPEKGPLELLESFGAAEKYLKVSTDLGLWVKVLQQSEGENLSLKTLEAIRCLVQILTLSIESETLLHPSQAFDSLAQVNFDEINWTTLLTRPPTDQEIKFYVVGHRDLLPGEQALIQRLETKFTVIKPDADPSLAQITSELPAWKDLRRSALKEETQILWLSRKDIPGPLESTYLLGIPQIRSSVSPLLRYDDLLKKSLLKKTFDFDEYFGSVAFTTFKEGRNLLIAKLKHLAPRLAYDLLSQLQLPNDTRVERHLPFSESPVTPLLLGLEDASIMDPGKTQIWANEDEWKNLFQKPARDPDELEKYFLAEGIVLPRLESEHARLLGFVNEIAKQGSVILVPERHETKLTTETSSQKSTRPVLRISPSGLESFYRCPLQFYFGREERLPLQETYDDLDGNPLRRGTWLHSVFEDLSFQEASEITQREIEQLLVKKSVKAFEGAGSSAYITLLQAQKKILAENIYHYVKGIEEPLQKLFPHRKIERELEVKVPWSKNITLMGRVDRLDFTGEEFFLWDYKSGDFSKATFPTAAKNGKFQWLLYAEIFEREGKPVVGGGYINPLQLSKSRLLFVDKSVQLLQNSFFDQLDRLEISYDVMKSGEFKDLKNYVVSLTHTLVEGMLKNERSAKPVNARECDVCSYHGLCGYPYGLSMGVVK